MSEPNWNDAIEALQEVKRHIAEAFPGGSFSVRKSPRDDDWGKGHALACDECIDVLRRLRPKRPCPSQNYSVLGAVDGVARLKCGLLEGHEGWHEFSMKWLTDAQPPPSSSAPTPETE